MNNDLTWIRTCQECKHKHYPEAPTSDRRLPKGYLSTICDKCKKDALDFGSYYTPDPFVFYHN